MAEPPRSKGDDAKRDEAAARAEGNAKGEAGAHPQAAAPGTPMTQQVGRAAMVAALILFVVFALANFQYVDFSWVFGSTEVVKQGGDRISGGLPLIVLLIIAFGLGAVVGTFGAWRRGRKRAKATEKR